MSSPTLITENCIRCNLCYVACEDGATRALSSQEIDGVRYPKVIEEECVGCNLCYLICPSPGAISMVRIDDGGPTQSWRQRTQLESSSSDSGRSSRNKDSSCRSSR